MESNIEWLRLQIWLAEWRLNVATSFNDVIGRAYEWYYPKPGWKFVDKLDEACAYKLGALWQESGKYEDEVEALTYPSPTGKSFRILRSKKVRYLNIRRLS